MMAEKMQPVLRGEMRFNEPMSRHTTWRVGGIADKLYLPADIDDLAEMMATLADDENIFWLGLGSNLLVRDGGIRGTVIALKSGLSDVRLLENNRIEVGAGISCAKLARFCSKNNLVGGEFLAGIPGLLGGALAMNAGAFGGETWKHVESVRTMDRHGNIHYHDASDFIATYRSVKGPENEWFVSAVMVFEQGDGAKAATDIRQLLDKRAQTQPTGLPSCGSVFRNPEGDYAARLIESCGLKGFRIGGAEVSEKHANFIINTGTASARDIEELINYVQHQVKKMCGISLQTEVKIVGEAV